MNNLSVLFITVEPFRAPSERELPKVLLFTPFLSGNSTQLFLCSILTRGIVVSYPFLSRDCLLGAFFLSALYWIDIGLLFFPLYKIGRVIFFRAVFPIAILFDLL